MRIRTAIAAGCAALAVAACTAGLADAATAHAANSPRIPASVRVVTITPVFGVSRNNGEAGGPRDRPVTVTGKATVAKIAGLIDALPKMPPGIFECPLSTGQALVLTFRATTGGPELAVVNSEMTGCGTVALVVGGKRMPLLWGGRKLDQRVLELAGIHWPGF